MALHLPALVERCSAFGKIQLLSYVPQRTFCCVTFDTVASAVACQAALHNTDFLGTGAAQRLAFMLLKKEAKAADRAVAKAAAVAPGEEKKKIMSPSVDASLLEDEMKAVKLESEHVHDVYNAIALHFSNTRYQPWPKVEKFVKELTPGFLVLDSGCGNGKYLGLNPSVKMLGCDISEELIAICRRKKYEVLVADSLALPFKENSFDAAISIAVLHHISTHKRRLALVSELVRVVKPGARILLCAWAVEQEDHARRGFESQDVYVPWSFPTRLLSSPQAASSGTVSPSQCGSGTSCASPPSTSSAASQSQPACAGIGADTSAAADSAAACTASSSSSSSSSATAAAAAAASPDVPTTTSERTSSADNLVGAAADTESSLAGSSSSVQHSGAGQRAGPRSVYDPEKDVWVYQRYCHMYKEFDIEKLFEEVGGTVLVDRVWDKGNWCITVQKLDTAAAAPAAP